MPNPFNPPTLWQKGDRFSASHLNESVEVARRLSSLGGNGCIVTSNPQGTTITVPSPENGGLRYGVLQNTGPNGEPDFTDSAYWVQEGSIDASGTGAATFTPNAALPDSQKVTNILETGHGLSPLDGTFAVMFIKGFDGNGNPANTMMIGGSLPFPRPYLSNLVVINGSNAVAFVNPIFS